MSGLRRCPLPTAEEIHVWWIDLLSTPDDDAILSAEERIRAARFHLERDRVRWMRSHAALRRILGGYLGLPPHDVQFASAAPLSVPLSPIAMGEEDRRVSAYSGKPALANDPRLRFNLSHAGDRAALAVAWEREVGIDLEPIAANLDIGPLLGSVCTGLERALLQALPENRRIEAFLKLWTAKEGCLKAEGVGLYRDVRTLEVEFLGRERAAVHDIDAPARASRWEVRFLEAGPGWVAALAGASAEQRVRPFVWPPAPDAPC